MHSPFGSTFVKVVISLIWIYFSEYAEGSCFLLPEYLDRPINDSITSINLFLDEKRYQISVKRQLTIPTLQNMNRGMDHGGPVESLINVGRFVYRRFISEADSRTNMLIAEIQERLLEASKKVQDELNCILAPCELERLVESIDELLQQIEPQILNLRSNIDDRHWDLFDRIARRIYKLHKSQVCSEAEYTEQMEKSMTYAEDYCARYENEIANEEEYLVAQAADEMRQMVIRALGEHSSRQDL